MYCTYEPPRDLLLGKRQVEVRGRSCRSDRAKYSQRVDCLNEVLWVHKIQAVGARCFVQGDCIIVSQASRVYSVCNTMIVVFAISAESHSSLVNPEADIP